MQGDMGRASGLSVSIFECIQRPVLMYSISLFCETKIKGLENIFKKYNVLLVIIKIFATTGY